MHPLGAGRSPTDELGRKRRMTQFILRLRFVAMWKVFFERSFDKRKDTSVFIIGKIFDVNKWMIYFYLDTLL